MLIEQIPKLIAQNKTVALVTVTSASGSTPAEAGKDMLVDESGIIGGTIGGGNLEFITIQKTQECIARNLNKTIQFDLKKDLGMECGGHVQLFIKIYAPPTHIVLIGGGHVGQAVYQFAEILGYETIVIDDREEVVTKERFPNAKQLILGNVAEQTAKLDIAPQSTYVVIASHGHKNDEEALYHMIQKHPKYIGVIGSKHKTATMLGNLKQRGIAQELLDSVYSPIGISLGGGQPAEVALSIISEILLVKNNGTLKHMRLKTMKDSPLLY